jgi:hypothetical protein
MIVRKEKNGRFMGGYKFKNFIGDPVPFAVQKKGWGGGIAAAEADAKKRRKAAATAVADEAEVDEEETEDVDAEEAVFSATESVMDRFGSHDTPPAVTPIAERTVLINETITTPVGVEKNHVVISKVKTEKKTRTTVAGSRTKKTNATAASNTKPPATTVEQFFVSSTVTASADSDDENVGVINLGHV